MSAPCELWPMATDANGYGQVRFDGRVRYAHRLAYCEAHELDIEDIDGKVVMHLCDNPPCVNPEHLALGTHADNVADKVRKRRHPYGEKHPDAKLSDDDVAAIRSSVGVQGKELAKRYGVSKSTISVILNRKSRVTA